MGARGNKQELYFIIIYDIKYRLDRECDDDDE